MLLSRWQFLSFFFFRQQYVLECLLGAGASREQGGWGVGVSVTAPNCRARYMTIDSLRGCKFRYEATVWVGLQYSKPTGHSGKKRTNHSYSMCFCWPETIEAAFWESICKSWNRFHRLCSSKWSRSWSKLSRWNPCDSIDGFSNMNSMFHVSCFMCVCQQIELVPRISDEKVANHLKHPETNLYELVAFVWPTTRCRCLSAVPHSTWLEGATDHSAEARAAAHGGASCSLVERERIMISMYLEEVLLLDDTIQIDIAYRCL